MIAEYIVLVFLNSYIYIYYISINPCSDLFSVYKWLKLISLFLIPYLDYHNMPPNVLFIFLLFLSTQGSLSTKCDTIKTHR